MPSTDPRDYSACVAPEFSDFRPHRFDPAAGARPAEAPAAPALPEFLLCVAGQGALPGCLPGSIRPLAAPLYRIEEALLARAPQVRRALCCGTQVFPLAEITVPDVLPPDVFQHRAGEPSLLLHALSEACAVAESSPQPAVPTRLLLLTDLAPDRLPLPMLRLLLERLHTARPGLRTALLPCGTTAQQDIWAVRLRELAGGIPSPMAFILPEELSGLYDFLFPGGDA